MLSVNLYSFPWNALVMIKVSPIYSMITLPISVQVDREACVWTEHTHTHTHNTHIHKYSPRNSVLVFIHFLTVLSGTLSILCEVCVVGKL
jgi:hypothetical protein